MVNDNYLRQAIERFKRDMSEMEKYQDFSINKNRKNFARLAKDQCHALKEMIRHGYPYKIVDGAIEFEIDDEIIQIGVDEFRKVVGDSVYNQIRNDYELSQRNDFENEFIQETDFTVHGTHAFNVSKEPVKEPKKEEKDNQYKKVKKMITPSYEEMETPEEEGAASSATTNDVLKILAQNQNLQMNCIMMLADLQKNTQLAIGTRDDASDTLRRSYEEKERHLQDKLASVEMEKKQLQNELEQLKSEQHSERTAKTNIEKELAEAKRKIYDIESNNEDVSVTKKRNAELEEKIRQVEAKTHEVEEENKLLYHYAYLDALTQSFNSNKFNADLQGVHNGHVLALISLVNLDKWNEEFGRKNADKILVNMSEQLKRMFGENHVYRIMSSQFAVLTDENSKGAIDREILNFKKHYRNDENIDIIYGIVARADCRSNDEMITMAEKNLSHSDSNTYENNVNSTPVYQPQQSQATANSFNSQMTGQIPNVTNLTTGNNNMASMAQYLINS